MNMAKICGWALLIVGIIIIIWTLYSSYNIFIGKAEVPEIFKTEVKQITSKSGTQDIQAQLEKMIGEQLKGMIPADTFPKLLNLVAWSILAFILIFGGTQISTIGIKLIK